MPTSIQVVAAMIRGGDAHHKLGDPWTWHIDVISHAERPWVAVLQGAVTEVPAHRDEIFDCLRRAGFTSVGWARAKGGRLTYKEWDL